MQRSMSVSDRALLEERVELLRKAVWHVYRREARCVLALKQCSRTYKVSPPAARGGFSCSVASFFWCPLW